MLYFVGFYVLLLFDIVLCIQVENLTAITASEQTMAAYLQNSFFSAGYLMAASIVALKCLNLVPDLAAWMIPEGDTAFYTELWRRCGAAGQNDGYGRYRLDDEIMINLILNIQKMNVQQKIEKWCRNERFVHYANERISEELVYAPNHRIDPEYEEAGRSHYMGQPIYCPYDDLPYLSSAIVKLQKMPRIETAVSGGYSCM